jgi:hypothetical protein
VAPHKDPTKLILPSRNHTYKVPSRVTLNEQKREAWIADLANPSVPLQKLARGVPHGYRGEKLIDMLNSKRVLVSRAVWYIRAIGANEIVKTSLNCFSQPPGRFVTERHLAYF